MSWQLQEHDYSTIGLIQANYFAFTNAAENIVSNKHLWHLDKFSSAGSHFFTPDEYFCENHGSFISSI